MIKLMTAAALLLAPSAPGTSDSGVWRACTIDTVFACLTAGCVARQPSISLFVSDYMDASGEHGAYYRCKLHLTGCNRYTAVVYRTGDTIVFSLPGHSAFAKLAADGRITDAAAVGDTVFVSRGRCATRAPPKSLGD